MADEDLKFLEILNSIPEDEDDEDDGLEPEYEDEDSLDEGTNEAEEDDEDE